MTQGQKKVFNSHTLDFLHSTLIRTVHIELYCHPTAFPRSLCHKWRIYHIAGRAFLFSVDISPCPLLSAIITQQLLKTPFPGSTHGTGFPEM